jgi:hypothetical protein
VQFVISVLSDAHDLHRSEFDTWLNFNENVRNESLHFLQFHENVTDGLFLFCSSSVMCSSECFMILCHNWLHDVVIANKSNFSLNMAFMVPDFKHEVSPLIQT